MVRRVTTRERVDYLDGLRALAIGAVLAVHWIDDYTVFGRGGHLGVDLFFVLSGYIITTILWRSRAHGVGLCREMGDFLVRRVRRLYPALIGLTVAVTAISAFVAIGPYDVVDVARQAAVSLAQLTWLNLADGGPDNVFGHTWSLGIEWIFYLVWPWVLLALRRRGVGAAQVAVLAGATGVVLYVSSFALEPLWFAYGPSGRTGVMLAGSALALAMIAAPPRPLQRTWAADAVALTCLAAFGAYVLVGHASLDPGVRLVGVPLAAAVGCYLIWYGRVRDSGPVTGLLTLPSITLLGRVSYSLYLWHIAPLAILDKDLIDLPLPLLGLFGVMFTLVATALSYRFLERPFTRSRGTLLAASEPKVAATSG